MSKRNGDRARFQKERKKKLRRREHTEESRTLATAEAKTLATPSSDNSVAVIKSTDPAS